MKRNFFHPRMLASVPGEVYPNRITIQEAEETRLPSGQKQSTWSNVADLVDLPGRITPAGGGERRLPAQIYEQTTHVINLAGFYPTITTKHRAVADDGRIFNIILPERDANQVTTRLMCELIR